MYRTPRSSMGSCKQERMEFPYSLSIKNTQNANYADSRENPRAHQKRGPDTHNTQQLGGKIGKNNAFGFLKEKNPLNFKLSVLENKSVNI